jgi:hypothetical protein
MRVLCDEKVVGHSAVSTAVGQENKEFSMVHLHTNFDVNRRSKDFLDLCTIQQTY